MALGKQLPIRLDPSVEARLEQAAQVAGTSKSAIVRMLTETFVNQCVRGGRVTLPPDWAELLPRRDERAGGKSGVNLHTMDRAGVGLNEEAVPPSVGGEPKKVNYRAALKADAKKRKRKGEA